MSEAFDGRHPLPAPGAGDDLQIALAAARAQAREIDHRAKNSLQLVSSLLLLASRRAGDPAAGDALRAMQQRVSAIAAVHRQFSGEAGEGFDLTALVRELAREAGQLARRDDVALQLDLQAVRTSAAKAAPLALIVNELAANALRHGCPPDRPGAVDIRLQALAAGFQLTVQDAGPGLPPDAEQRGFGLTIVRLMAQQLGARFEFAQAQPGVRAVVTAP